MAKETVLVTGGAGFIGSHMCDALIARGYKVVCADNLVTGKKENLSQWEDNPDFVFEYVDVNTLEELAPVFDRHTIDYIFHYANLVGVKRLEEEPLLFLDDINGSRNIVDLAKQHNVKKVAYSSSSEVYGVEPAELPMREEGKHNTNPRDTYSLAKLLGENLTVLLNDTFHIPTVVFRFFNVYGPRQESSEYGFVAGVFIQQVLEGKRPTVFGKGDQTRSFMYIEDNINICLDLFFNEQTNGHVVNVGNPRQTAISDLAETIIRISGKEVIPEYLPARKVDTRYRTPDTTKMEEFSKAQITTRLEEGLRKTYEWYKNRFEKGC